MDRDPFPELVPELVPELDSATILPWVDPIIDARGHDPRSAYVERYWLSVIGPTATWIMRRFADRFDVEPDGFSADLDEIARTMGLSFTRRQRSPFGKALRRCAMFGVVQPLPEGYAVRRRFPSVTQRHLGKLPRDVQAEHDTWERRTFRVDVRELENALVGAGLPTYAAIRAAEAAYVAA